MADDKTQEIELGITRLEYGDTTRPQRAVLELKTGKHYDGGLVCRASVYWHGFHSRSQLIGLGTNSGDYSRRPARTDTGVRATQKNIDNRHAEIFTPEAVAAITAEAKAHYAGVVEAGIDGFKNTYPTPEAAVKIS